jgi:FtsP/CotA-like multicopper oxidase with cupredoxin domain
MPIQSRIPEPMSVDDLRQYRWLEKLPVLETKLPVLGGDIPAYVFPKTSSQKIVVCMGLKQNHVFAASPCPSVLPDIRNDVWGYAIGTDPISYPGPVLVAEENQPISVEWKNELPGKFPFVHPMPDLAAPGSMMQRYSTGHAAVHMHGARVTDGCDGYPMRKTSAKQKTILRPPLRDEQGGLLSEGESVTYEYPNEQPGGATLWYHDHAMDMTAKNVYAGLAGGYLLRHKNEGDLKFLPQLPYEIPLIIQDRSFTSDGDLLYGDVAYLAGRIDAAQKHDRAASRALLPPSPELKGHAICVNGKLWPTLEVEPRPYRFRIYNGANSRMFVLRLSSRRMEIDPLTGSVILPEAGDTHGDPALPIYQIGSDGGIFKEAVVLSGDLLPSGLPTSQNFLVLAPGERADVVIDFSHLTREIKTECGTIENIVYLTNHAYTTNPGMDNEQGTNCGNIGDHADRNNMMDSVLQIRLKPMAETRCRTLKPGADAAYLERLKNDLSKIQPTVVPPAAASVIRRFIINEFPLYFTKDDAQNVHPSRGTWKAITFEVPVGATDANVMYSGKPGFLWGGKPIVSTVVSNTPPPPKNDYAGMPNGGPVTDPNDVGIAAAGSHTQPYPIRLGTSERWEIYNLTGDVHPIHLHLVNFKVKFRESLDSAVLAAVANSMANPHKHPKPINLVPSPNALKQGVVDKNESAWKDTVRANHGERITLDAFFDAASPQEKDYSGDFVWHCHLIEHEDMGMMRPLRVEKKI